MSTLGTISAPRSAPRRGAADPARPRKTTFADRLGFHPAATPFIVALGLAFLMATMPQLFRVLAGVDSGPGYLHSSLEYVWDMASRWSVTLGTWSDGTAGRVALQVGIVAVPALWLAAAVRSIRVRTWKPLVVTVVASVLGVLGIPIATWIGEVVVFLWRIAGYIVDFFAFILPWVARVVLWIGAIAIGIAIVAAAGFAIYSLVAYLARDRRWMKAALLALLAAGLTGAVALGWFDAFFAFLGDIVHFLGVWIDRIAGWIGAVLGPVVRFVGRIIVLVVVFLLIAGIAVGTLGQAGRTVYLPFTSAFRAGRDQGRCADLAAGSGVTMSLVLTAAVLDPAFGARFASVWSETPFVAGLPMPGGGFGFLLPGGAEALLSPAFNGYLPIVDLAVLALIAALGAVSLLFGTPTWTDEHGSRIAVPILLAVGAAIALALVLIVIALWLASSTDS